jgi:hypothetical protein
VLDAVVAAGYDRDFDDVLAGARAALRPTRPCGRWREVVLDDDVLRLPPDVGLDLGGIAKGWTVDLAIAEALDEAVVGRRERRRRLRFDGDAPPEDLTSASRIRRRSGWSSVLILDRGAVASS